MKSRNHGSLEEVAARLVGRQRGMATVWLACENHLPTASVSNPQTHAVNSATSVLFQLNSVLSFVLIQNM